MDFKVWYLEFKNLKHLQNHTVKRTCLKVHVCEKCGKSFTLPSKLKRHIQEIKRECTDKIECQTCGKTFKVRRDLNRHKKRNNCIPYLTYFWYITTFHSGGVTLNHLEVLGFILFIVIVVLPLFF